MIFAVAIFSGYNITTNNVVIVYKNINKSNPLKAFKEFERIATLKGFCYFFTQKSKGELHVASAHRNDRKKKYFWNDRREVVAMFTVIAKQVVALCVSLRELC